MNRGILLKSFREVLPVTALLGMVLLAIEAVLSYVLPTFSQQFSAQMMRVEFIRNMIKAMLGTDLAEGIGPELFVAIPWVHPVVLAIVWAHAIICCTRVPAGEVDRGTIDVLLGLPVSRWNLHISDTLVCVASAVGVLLLGAAGNALGTWRAAPAQPPQLRHVALVLVNLLCVWAAVGAAAYFVSALSDRRGRAIGAVFLLVLASFLLNYLAQFWEPAQRIAHFGLLRFYRPLYILRDGTWPLRDITVLLGAGAVLWLAAGMIFARRDLATL